MKRYLKVKLVLIYLYCLIEIKYATGAFSCPSHRGQFADEKNCRVFYQCENNIAYRKRCPPGSLYDGGLHECRNRHEEVLCGPQPTTEATVTTPDPFASTECDESRCLLPECFCTLTGTEIPGKLKNEETPQMIMITFDGAINQNNFETYRTIFEEHRVNPNGCPIKATFFVTHEYSDYAKIQQFYSEGHEIAIASVTRRQGLEDDTYEDWVGEMVTMREILSQFADVNPLDIIGVRAPHLRPGRNQQFDMLYDYGFFWDSSMTVPPGGLPVWPYTLDHKIPHECRSGSCPTRVYKGIWEVPMNAHYEDTSYHAGYCPYLDQCVLTNLDENEVFQWLSRDFHRHYDYNKAPYHLSLSVNWFNTRSLHRALLRFIDHTLNYTDVYYTTVTETLQWIAQPEPVNVLNPNPTAFDCQRKLLPETVLCQSPKSCALGFDPDGQHLPTGGLGTRYMATCFECPNVYPWVFDSRGIGRSHKDIYPKITEELA